MSEYSTAAAHDHISRWIAATMPREQISEEAIAASEAYAEAEAECFATDEGWHEGEILGATQEIWDAAWHMADEAAE